MKGRSKARRRKAESIERANSILNAIARSEIDLYEGYRALYATYCANNAALEFLKPLFCIPGIEPDGVFSVTDDFRKQVIALTQSILASHVTE
jgi:hypothetical protein